MEPSVEDMLNKYHIRDAREIARLFPSKEFVDVTVTSPPYWDLKDYGTESQIGFGQDYEQYLNDLELVFRSVYNVTKEKGSLWIISDTIKHKGKLVLLPFDLARKLERVGWILQDIIIWNKDRTLPWSHQGKLRNIFEYIAFYTKGRRFNYHLDRVREVTNLKEWWVRYPERYSPEGKAPARTWYIPIPRQGSWGSNWVRHFNPLPPQLVERIILLTTNEGDVVLDPFSGSGTVLAQAYVMGRNYLGLDLNEDYKKMFEHRVLPAICALHEENQGHARRAGKRKEIFKNLIHSLRKTKYPKELVRLYRKRFGPVQIEAIIALQNPDPVSNSLNIIFLFPRRLQIPSYFLPQASALCKIPPLSKYGIEPVLAACPVDSVSPEWLENEGVDLHQYLYVYMKGRTYAWAQSMSVEDCVGMLADEQGIVSPDQRFPPIISDIAVKVDPKSPTLSIGEENE